MNKNLDKLEKELAKEKMEYEEEYEEEYKNNPLLKYSITQLKAELRRRKYE